VEEGEGLVLGAGVDLLGLVVGEAGAPPVEEGEVLGEQEFLVADGGEPLDDVGEVRVPVGFLLEVGGDGGAAEQPVAGGVAGSLSFAGGGARAGAGA